MSLLLWRPRSATFPAIEPIYAAAARGGAGFLETVPRGHWLERLTAATSRKSFIESQINAWTALGEYRAAIELFEKHFGPRGFRPDADLLYTMVIPYGESGDLRKAAQCLRRAEEMAAEPNPQDLRRFVAFLHAYAQAGRVYALERLLDRNAAAASALPPAYVRLWRGVALLRHGEPEAAHDVIASALARQREGEAWLRRIAEPYLAPGRAAPAALDAGRWTPTSTRSSCSRSARRSPSLGRSSPPSPGNRCSPGASSPPAWPCGSLTELSGSSEAPYTLAQFGANVPGLVKAGEWWRLVASVFLHVGPLHLLFNLYALYLFGAFVERLAGRWEMFVVFMVAGICGSAASTWLGNPALSAGASGAIMGLLGAAIGDLDHLPGHPEARAEGLYLQLHLHRRPPVARMDSSSRTLTTSRTPADWSAARWSACCCVRRGSRAGGKRPSTSRGWSWRSSGPSACSTSSGTSRAPAIR